MEIQTQKTTNIPRILLITIIILSTISLFIMPVLAASTPDFSQILALIISVVPIMIILGVLGLVLGYLKGRS